MNKLLFCYFNNLQSYIVSRKSKSFLIIEIIIPFISYTLLHTTSFISVII